MYLSDNSFASRNVSDTNITYEHVLSSFNISVPTGHRVTKVEVEAKYYTQIHASIPLMRSTFSMVACLGGEEQGVAASGYSASAALLLKEYSSGNLLRSSNLTNALFTVKVKASSSVVNYGVWCDYVKVTITTRPDGGGIAAGCMF
jgi:hypothetical protein